MKKITWTMMTIAVSCLAWACNTDSPPNNLADGGADGDTDTDTDTDADGDSDADADADADTDSDSDGDACTETIADWEGDETEAGGWVENEGGETYAGIEVWSAAIASDEMSYDAVFMEIWDVQVDTYDLEEAEDPEECEACLFFTDDCVEGTEDDECAKVFFGVMGTVDVTEINPTAPWEGNLSFEAQSLIFREVNVDWDNDVFEFVEDGDVLCIDLWDEAGMTVEDWSE